MTAHAHVKNQTLRSTGYVLIVGLAALMIGIHISGCSEKNWRPASERVYTEAELKGLQGRTRDEVRDFLGDPKGLYTIDAKGRWHYAHLKIEVPENQEHYEATVLIYFSQLGEQRVTIVEITKRTE